MMNMPKLQPHFWVLILITLFMGLYRVIGTSTSWTFYTQFTPLGAMALFGGAYFRSQPHALLMPLLTLFVSDIIIMQTVFPNYQSGLLYAGWYWTYLSFMGMTVIGRYFLYKRVGIFRFIGRVFFMRGISLGCFRYWGLFHGRRYEYICGLTGMDIHCRLLYRCDSFYEACFDGEFAVWSDFFCHLRRSSSLIFFMASYGKRGGFLKKK